MKNVFTLIKKEFSRFFKDKRMVLSILLPGVMIFVVYSLMGTVMEEIGKTDPGYRPTVCVINAPEEVKTTFSLLFELKEEDENTAKEKVVSGGLDALVVFPEGFTLGGQPQEKTPDVQIFFDSSKDNSSAAYRMASGLLEGFKQPAFTVNNSLSVQFDLAEGGSVARVMLSILIPMVVFAFLASAGMSVAPESIAGEKERGTMATMLITPVKRWQLALGKIISLACFAFLSGISSFLGIMFSLPKLTAGLVDADTAIMYSFAEYISLLGVIVSIVLVIISLFSVISCFAKSVKESGSLITPFMIVIILMGMGSVIFQGTPATPLFLIPLMGSGLAMSGIMSQTASALQIVLSICSNLVVAALLIVLLAFMFKSEKIMFKK